MMCSECFKWFFKPLKKTAGLCLVTILASVILLNLAHNPRWRGHLQADTVIYQKRACAFMEAHSWGNIPNNEYQPGALWWVTLPALVPLDCHNYDAYVTAYWLLNLIVLGAFVALTKVFGPPEAPWMLLLLAVASGPILLYRFELTVSLMVFVAWLLWERRRWWASSLMLGVATSTKVYPLILMPVLVGKAYREGGVRAVIRVVVGFALGIGVVLGAFLWAGGKLFEAYAALMFHKHKPIGLDGLMGGVIPLYQAIVGMPMKMTPQNSIHGFAFDAFHIGPVLDWVWISIYLGALLLLLKRRPHCEVGGAGTIFALLLAFLVMQKTYTPQYSWWAACMLPMISGEWLSKSLKTALFIIVLAALVLGQIAYPLHYQELINAFYGGHPVENPIFWINLLKNLLWLAALAIGIWPALPTRITIPLGGALAATKDWFLSYLWSPASPGESGPPPPGR